MITEGFFITGTDTDIGKTTLAASFLYLLGKQGFRTLGLKPVAAGGNDSEILRNHANISCEITQITPFLLQEPIAPHLAAAHENETLSVARILSAYQNISEASADKIIIEGAGGWLTPLNDTETFADLAKALDYPVILIVGMKLGCINHALLTIQSIQAKGLHLKGWVANCIDPNMLCLEENISSLKKRISAPLLGIVPYQKEVDIAKIAEYINCGDTHAAASSQNSRSSQRKLGPRIK